RVYPARIIFPFSTLGVARISHAGSSHLGATSSTTIGSPLGCSFRQLKKRSGDRSVFHSSSESSPLRILVRSSSTGSARHDPLVTTLSGICAIRSLVAVCFESALLRPTGGPARHAFANRSAPRTIAFINAASLAFVHGPIQRAHLRSSCSGLSSGPCVPP